jgi:hypothetical protein
MRSRIGRAIENRIQVAQRWFGLGGEDDIVAFVQRDPDVQELANADADRLVRQGLESVIEDLAANRNIEEHRRAMGDKFVDEVLAELRTEGLEG